MSNSINILIDKVRYLNILLVLLLTFANSTAARIIDTEKVITFERGGILDSNGIVDKGALHVEAGLMNYGTDAGLNGGVFTFPSMLYRYGVIQDRFELRAFTNGLILSEKGDSTRVGFDNLSLGHKISLTEEGKYMPDIDLISQFAIPLGDDDLASPGFSHFYKFLFSHKLTEKSSLSANLGPSFVSRMRADGTEFTSSELPYVVSLGYFLNDRLIVFGQVFGNWILTNNFENSVGISYGLNYIITEDLVFDISANHGLNSDTQDFGMTFGLSYRIF